MVRYLVTSALPYANGPMHFGHVVGAYLPADVYVRTLRMKGEEVLFVCGTDEHGVAITIGAEREGVPYADYVARWRTAIKHTFDRVGIEFDVWSGTSISPPHAELSREFFRRLHAGGYLLERASEQLYCPTCDLFLADRYVVGTCYVCGHEAARGDECPKCGSWLEVLRLRSPRCKVCGGAPRTRSTVHWYLDLPKLRDERIGAWFAEHPWKPNVERFIGNQLAEIEPRPITRDMKWGVPVPEEIAGAHEGKVLYVWFDAPIGYVSFTREWAERRGDPHAWERWWKDADTRLVHFIGKDNVPFHCLIFPAMLWGVKQGYVLPWQVPANEFYNLQGRKFSTSENWTLPPDEFFTRFDRDVVRFYLLASAPESADSEWRWEDFQRAANAQLADAIGNLTTRVLRFLAKNFDGRIPEARAELLAEMDRQLLGECGDIGDPADHVIAFRFRRACETLVANATVGNVFVDRLAPWTLRKSDPERTGAALATACEWIGWLARWMAPILPEKSRLIWRMLGRSDDPRALPWPGTPAPGRWRMLEPGTSLGEIQAPFAKIPDEVVQQETARLVERAAHSQLVR
jgi:methionyl-tRNA synthetase